MAQDYIPAVVPVPGQVISVVLQFSTFGVLCVCISKLCLFEDSFSVTETD